MYLLKKELNLYNAIYFILSSLIISDHSDDKRNLDDNYIDVLNHGKKEKGLPSLPF